MTKEEKKKLEEQNAAVDRFKESTKLLDAAQEELGKQLKQADKCFDILIDQAQPEEKAKAQQIVNKVNNLLAKLKGGGDVNDIVKQIKDLA